MSNPKDPENPIQEVYDELRALARQWMRREHVGHTLDPTALVHEAFLRLHPATGDPLTREQFVAYGAIAMRRILIEHARRASATKRGGGRQREGLTHVAVAASNDPIDVVVLVEALEELEKIDKTCSSIAMCRFLMGCTVDETAAALNISTAQVKRDWTFARSWLRVKLSTFDNPAE